MTRPALDPSSAPFTVRDETTNQLNAGMTEEGQLFLRDGLPPERKRKIIRDFFRARTALEQKHQENPTARRGEILQKLDRALSQLPSATGQSRSTGV